MGGGQTVWRLLYTLFLLIALVTVAGCDTGKGPDGQDDAMLEATEALHRAKQKVRTGTWRIIFPSFSEIRKHTFSLLHIHFAFQFNLQVPSLSSSWPLRPIASVFSLPTLLAFDCACVFLAVVAYAIIT